MAGPGRDLSAELFGDSPAPVKGGRDLSAELFGDQPKKDQPSGIAAFAAGAGKGLGSAVLTLQQYLGKGLSAISKDDSAGNRAGQWLTNDAAAGKQRLSDELATYANAHPTLSGLGDFGGSVVATLPVGGLLGAGAKALGASPAVASALATGGMRAPGATGLSGAGLRALGGAVNGGLSGAVLSPDDIAAGALVGGALPGVAKLGGVIGSGIEKTGRGLAENLMQSAIKPTIKQLQTGDAATAVDTLLKYGINPNQAGVEKLRSLIDGLNTQIGDKIANSTATIDKNAALSRLDDTRQFFGNQVSPTADLNAIQNVADDFLAHPNYLGDTLSVQDAQALKQGTYQTLAKKYGQLGSADTEAQKGLARGLKEEIANAVPEVAGLNAAESKLITTLKVSERRALMELNKNPQGLAALASNPVSWAMFMADRSSTFKALAARMVNGSSSSAGSAVPALTNRLSNPLLRNSILSAVDGGERQ